MATRVIETMDLAADEVGLFGYGSLLRLANLERTLGHRYRRDRFVCSISGWRRAWSSLHPNRRYSYVAADGRRVVPANMLYLNVHPGACQLNGVVYAIPAAALPAFDLYEETYARVEVGERLQGVQVRGGPVYLYVGQPPHVLEAPVGPEVAAIRRAYVETVEAGIGELGEEFRRGYEASSDGVPVVNVVDAEWA
ncbi:MAG: gamma-glutamylcyclotransferase family protein [Bryobacteraceae bacterium]